MNLNHLKYQFSRKDLSEALSNSAYLGNPNAILAIDLEIILGIADALNLIGDNYQNYKFSLNV